mgnify:CR=1 FL=1
MFTIGLLLFTFWVMMFVVAERFIPGSTQVDLDIKKRSLAIIRGLCSVFISGSYLLRTGLDYCEETTYQERLMVLFSMSFFIIDSVYCGYKGFWDKNLVYHHACTVGGLVFAFLAPYGGKVTLYGLLAGTSPTSL